MKTLVLGYGNTSRGDDGVGWYVVEQLQERDLPGLELMTSHQLDLDLAEIVGEYDAVYFVDAAVSDTPEPVTRATVRADASGHDGTHHLTPGDVLALSRCLYGREPEGVLYSIRGEHFDFAIDITPAVAESARAVAAEIADKVAGRCMR